MNGKLPFPVFKNIVKEALIKSLSDFILGFLCNARNNSTQIASYLRRVMTKQCIKILMKSDSANESVLP
jgi:branched-subunit amino acid transport protein AzlD